KMVRYDLVGITTEDGTSVRLSDAAMAAKEAGLNTIMPRSQVVLRVGDILMFDGMNRAAATVTVNSNPANISVATTQVNLEDGSTDTVIY
ncbi:MAG: FecR domain-containing protein, partial [Rhodospirillaceae bacterium]|nr:FecR domain-containing protein [Rhodospirillaceae bacterium]